ncbi:MAG: hypothetical protein AAFY64_10155, partial [Pseudomonadota bacterium]
MAEVPGSRTSDFIAAKLARVRTGVARAGGLAAKLSRGYARLRGWIGALPLIDQLAETVSWLANYGTEPYPEETRRRLKILNLIAYLIGATTLVYTLQHLTVDFAEYWPLIIVNAGLVSLAVVVPLSHRLSPIAGGVIVVIAEWVALLAIAAMVGAHAGVQLQYFIGAAAPFVVFGLERMRLVLATVIT